MTRDLGSLPGPLGSPWVRGVVGRFWLPVWFLAHTIPAFALQLQDTSLLYFDARLYLLASRAWLAGGDPWSAELAGNYYAAPPPSLLPFAPLTLLPDDAAVALVAALVIGAAILTIRLLRLPWWWLLFPPLVQTCFSANVHGLLLPCILLGGGALAALLKVYALLPTVILGRWQAVAAATVALLATVPVLPWDRYVSQWSMINGRLVEQTDIALPALVLVAATPVALLAMAVVGRDRAAWLAVPALWPSQQYYYGALAVGARSGVAAAIVAFPINGAGLLALLVLALLEWRRGARPHLPDRWPWPGRTFGAVTPRTGSVDSEP